MARNMSFALTIDQVRNRTKTVTRRFGWAFLRPGQILNAVEKSMGLKKGETVSTISLIRVVSVRSEPLAAITKQEVIAEGFPDMTPEEFIKMLIEDQGGKATDLVTRIEFAYLDYKPEMQLEFDF